MALKGTLTADFESFYAAVTKAKVQLEGFESGANKVEDRLNRATNAFQGNRIASQATIAVEAMNRIGGAAKLTDDEQAKVNKTLNEAIEKYQRLGKVAPDAWLEAERATRKADEETKKIPSSLDKIASSLKGIAGTIGLAFTADALIGFVGGVFSAAGQINDLSDKLGISAEAVQKFKYAADQSGASIETVDRALFEMNKRLGDGDKSTIAMLDLIGVKFDEVREMNPEQAFVEIAEAVRRIEDPMLQAKVATELFGKAGAELLPAIKAGIKEVGDQASTMSNDTIKALADAEDAWGRLKDKVVIVTGTIIGTTLNAIQMITSGWKEFFTFVEQAIKIGPAAAAVAMSNLQAIRNDMARMEGEEQERAERRKKSTSEFVEDAENRAKALEYEAQQAQAAAGRIANAHQQIFGLDKISAANDLVAAIGDLSRVSMILPEQQQKINTAMSSAIQVYGQFGQTAPQAMSDTYWATLKIPPVVSGLGEEFTKAGTIVQAQSNLIVDAAAKAEAAWMKAWQAEQDYMFALNEENAKIPEKTEKTKKAADANKELAASYELVTRSASDYLQLAAQAELDATRNLQRGGIAAQYGMFQTQQAREYRSQAGYQSFYENQIASAMGGGAAWGNRTLTVNVNGTTADDRRDGRTISQQLVGEMKSNGIRF
jgi:hypothetical protein